MNICVFGLWHLGTVTAACLAEAGFNVMGLDPDVAVVEKLQQGQPPVFEPGLPELLEQGLASGQLTFTSNSAEALAQAELVWVTFDTPVDDNDQADVTVVIEAINSLFADLPAGVLVLISSQLPAGSIRLLEKNHADLGLDQAISFACSPENLRLGQALEVFKNPDRIIAGVRTEADRLRLASVFAPFTPNIEWMSIESAEMTKHAINAFLATSVVFINELATLCEQVGADAKEIERGLKSESRIGPKAYLGPGSAFAGGTLARDISFLREMGQTYQQQTELFDSVKSSNEAHKLWPQRKLEALLGPLTGKQITVLGLTYKPNTDTLRRSSAVELCQWLHTAGVRVQAYDPAIKQLPSELSAVITLHPSAQAALDAAEAVVVATEWPEFKSLTLDDLVNRMKQPVVVDPNRFLAANLANSSPIQYATIGKSI